MTTTFSLANHLHAWTFTPPTKLERQVYDPRYFENAKLKLRMALREAKRFCLDDEFTKHAVYRAAAARNATTVMNQMHMLGMTDLANLPFNKIFVEFDLDTRINAQLDAHTMSIEKEEVDALIPYSRGGFLLERIHPDDASLYRATYISLIDPVRHKNTSCPISPVSYYVDTQGLGRFPNEPNPLQELLDATAWGTVGKLSRDSEKMVFAVTDELKKRGGGGREPRFTHYNPKYVDREKELEVLMDMAVETSGTLRFIVACFAMMNNVPTRYTPAKAMGPQSVRGRNIPFLDNETITIYTGKVRNLRRFLDHLFALARRRRHSVRGFWRNVDQGVRIRACEHVPVERDGNYALCGKCEALLRWIDHHERGDATLGYVDHDYEVMR